VKWITRDPLGEEGGINLTAAFGCDPINMYDRFGLAALNNLNSRLLFKPAEINQMFSPLAEAKDDFEKMQLGYFGLFGAAVTAPTWGGFAVDAVAEVTGLPISPRDIPDLARAAWHLPSNIRRVGTALRKPGIGSQLLSKLRFWKRGGDDVIERMAPKMKTVLGNGADVGPFRGKSGYNVLDMDRTLPLDSRKAININWLDDAIEQGDDIILKTDPIEWDRFMRDIGKESFYNEVELPHLMKRGVIDDVILDY